MPVTQPARALLAAAAFCCAGAAHAAAPATGLTGIWLLDQNVYDSQNTARPPLTPDSQAKVAAANKAVNEGAVIEDNARKCLPVGMPAMVTNEFALKFLETPGEVTVVSEASTLVRTIYLNKKTHPADFDPNWNGHSIGHWEGNTLVVDTVGLNDRTSHLPRIRGIAALGTHIVERYHLENGGQTLVNVMTMENPALLTQPWTVTYRYHRAEPDAELWEYVCEIDAANWTDAKAAPPKP